MNKILSILFGLTLTLTASAQNYQFRSFLNVRAVATGTNGLTLTNLSALVTNAGVVFSTNVVYTNVFGSVVRSAGSVATNTPTAGTNSINTAALFNDVAFWYDRDGRLPFSLGTFSGNPTANATNYPVSASTLYLEMSNPLGSNGPVGINFAPIWANDRTFESGGVRPTPTSTADDFSLLIAGNSGVVTLATNLPIWKWPGAYGLRVRNITNQYILAGDTAITNCPWITRMGVTGYIP